MLKRALGAMIPGGNEPSCGVKGAAAYVSGLSLNGSVITIHTNLHGSEAVEVIASIGGHYVEGAEVRSDGAQTATLSLARAVGGSR